MFPVALDSTAFNLPESVTRMNFIRYGTSPAPQAAVPGKPTDEELMLTFPPGYSGDPNAEDTRRPGTD